MPIDAQLLIERIRQIDLLKSARLEAFLEELGQSELPRGGELARRMVEIDLLTDYQAQRLLKGRTRGLVIDTYVVLDLLGAGGMGQVFKALHRRMDRLVALKVLKEKMLDSPEAVERFRREVKAVARLTHPNIVTAFDADDEDGIHYFVMEYIAGIDLAALGERGDLSPVQAVDYIIQAARGFEYAHNQGIVHRDIKPSNLLVDENGTVKVLDMGLARWESGSKNLDHTQAKLTQAGLIIGTVDFMSPEQALNSDNADVRSDVYSLGCTLYYLLSGEPAYGGETIVEKIFAHRIDDVPSLWQTRPSVPEALDAVVRRMMAKDADDRYQTMTEVIAALEVLDDLAGQKETKIQQRVPDATLSSQRDTDAYVAPSPIDDTPVSVTKTSEEQENLERYIDGCGGPDHYIDTQEEHAIFRKGGELGLTLDEVEEVLQQRCADGSWTRLKTLTETLAEMLQQAAGDDGAIDQIEYQQIIDYAVCHKMPRKSADEHCITLILDNRWRPKEGMFNKWFTEKRRQHGLQ